MKIICIEGNYPPHGGNGAAPGAGPGTEPVWFLKPDTAMLRNNDPFYIPRFTREVHAACGLIVRISRVGRAVSERFAHRYYDEVGVGIDFTARDLPPRFVRLAEAGGDVARLRFALDVNGERRQTGDMRELLFPVDRLIAAVSQYMTLRMGDLLFTGTPAGAGPVQAGDNLRATLEGYGMLDFDIR